MEANEKTPVPDGHSKMDVLPEVYLWYHPRLWTQIYCPLKSHAEMYLLKWRVYPVEKSLQEWNGRAVSTDKLRGEGVGVNNMSWAKIK